VHGHEAADYTDLLSYAGYELRQRNAGKVLLGGSFAADTDGLRMSAAPLRGTPLYEAGMDRNDLLLSIDGQRFSTAESLDKYMLVRSPGDVVTIRFLHRGLELQATTELIEDPSIEVISYEAAGRTLTEEQRSFRAHWLGSRAAVHMDARDSSSVPR
jgi:predicted metalloprotease with PDZ domain